MQLNRNQTIEINLKDLFFHILYRWRSILIAALIGALVLCGYQYWSIKKVHDEGKLTKEERQYQIDLQNYKEDLESTQSTIRVNTQLLQGQNAYRNESIYIQLDAQSVWTASNKYLVKVDQSVLDKLPQGSTLDPADSILSAYTSPLSEAMEEELKEAFGTEKPEYISELVATEISTGENTVTVFVKAASKETAQAGMALLDAKMKALSTGKAQEIGAHELVIVSSETALKADKDLAEKQEALAKSIMENQTALQEARQKLDKLEAVGEPKEPGWHLIRMAVTGMILGIFLPASLYAVLYVLRGKLHNGRVISMRYKLPVFGALATSGSQHANKGLDKLLAKWELGKMAADDETIYDNIAALIAEKQGTGKVQFVSTLPAEKLQKTKEAFVKRLPDRTIDVQGDFNHHSEGIMEAANADAVIIAEEKDVSRLKDMDRMAETLIIAEANVIGAIVL